MEEPTSKTPPPGNNLIHVSMQLMQLTLYFMNVRSARERMLLIGDHISSHDCDIIGLTETWLTDSERDLPYLQLLSPPGYRFHPRTTGHRGGGVRLLYRSTLKATAGHPETF